MCKKCLCIKKRYSDIKHFNSKQTPRILDVEGVHIAFGLITKSRV